MKLADILVISAIVLIPSIGMARDEPQPDMEMLEYLGGFETAGGKPLDPLGFADYEAKANKREQTESVRKSRKPGRKPEKQEQKDRDDEK